MAFSLLDYMKMLQPARAELFHSELRSAITRDSVVLDLGAGFGHFAIYAAKLGARHVFAIETNPAVKVCKVLARKNNVADRVTVIQADSRSVKLPESVDVLIADVRGSLPFFQDSLQVIQHACQNFLAQSGLVMPFGDDVFVCPVEYPEFASRTMPVDFTQFDLDYSALGVLTNSSPARTSGRETRLLSTPAKWSEVRHSYSGTDIETYPLRFQIESSGCLDGLLVWSKLLFPTGSVLNNDPKGPGLPYGQAFFPFREAGVQVDDGQEVHCDLKPMLVGRNTQWRWSADIEGKRRIENNSIVSALFG